VQPVIICAPHRHYRMRAAPWKDEREKLEKTIGGETLSKTNQLRALISDAPKFGSDVPSPDFEPLQLVKYEFAYYRCKSETRLLMYIKCKPNNTGSRLKPKHTRGSQAQWPIR